MLNGIQVRSEFFWRTKFFPTVLTAVFRQVWRSSIFKFCVYKFAEAVRYLKFKWEFVIIGRGCLVLLWFYLCSSQVCVGGCCVLQLCKGYVPLGLNFLVLIRHLGLRAGSQWIIILKTFELVTLSFSQFHVQRNWLLTLPYISFFNQYMRLLCCCWSLMWLRKIENSFLTVCFVRLVIHSQ